MITMDQFWGPFADSPEITVDVIKNGTDLVAKVNDMMLAACFDNLLVTSGFRTIAHNAAIGGAKNSTHCSGLAIDISDPDKSIGQWCLANLDQLMSHHLYLESLSVTHASQSPSGRWIHLQSRAPRSGNTVFLP